MLACAGDLHQDLEPDEVDEQPAADRNADAHTAKSSRAPGSTSFADAFAEILAHPGPAGGQAAPILAVRHISQC